MIAPSASMSHTRRPFVLITGLSGAGRATALHALEDFGYTRGMSTAQVIRDIISSFLDPDEQQQVQPFSR